MKELGKIAKILVQDMVPRYNRVRVGISTAYQVGVGWDDASREARTAFHNAVRSYFSSFGWDVRDDGSITVRKSGQYLYVHPMELSGYILPDSVDELQQILSFIPSSVIYDFADVELGIGVYAMSDADVVRAFTRHKKEIWSVIAPIVSKTDPARIESVTFDDLLASAVIPRNNELGGSGGLSSNMVEYAMLVNEAKTLLFVWGREVNAEPFPPFCIAKK